MSYGISRDIYLSSSNVEIMPLQAGSQRVNTYFNLFAGCNEHYFDLITPNEDSRQAFGLKTELST